MKYLVLLGLLYTGIVEPVLGQPRDTPAALPSNLERAKQLGVSMTRWLERPAEQLYVETDQAAANEKPFSYLWPLCALVQSAQQEDQVAGGGLRVAGGGHRVEQVMRSIRQYYDPRPPAPGYASYVTDRGGGDRFYDDNQWIGIALMDAWRVHPDPGYLRDAREIYRFMMTGYDTLSGGGLYWKEGDLSTKNTCSNGPGVVLALQLYEATGQQSYLDTALQLYHWVNRWMRTPGEVYWDNLRVRDGNRVDSAVYSYNTGIMIQANMLLFRVTGDSSWLREARELADGSYRHFFRDGYFHSSYWFNAVLLRGYEALYAVDTDDRYMRAMQEYADRVWLQERDARGLIGKRKEKHLLDQAGMQEIYFRLSRWK